jgi:hypothetical protein
VDRLYLNGGDGTFATAWALDNGGTSGATLGDYDGDGDLDLALTNNAFPAGGPVTLYRNDTGNGNHWLALDLVGDASNRAAIGAKVWVTATIGGEEVTQFREVSAQNTFCGQNALTVHVGLGDAATADVRIEWPSGVVTETAGVAADRRLRTVEGLGVAGEPGAMPERTTLEAPVPNPTDGPALLRYTLAVPSAVRLAVYDALGREVAVLTAGAQQAGTHAARFDARTLPSGVYLALLRHADGVEARRFTVTR